MSPHLVGVVGRDGDSVLLDDRAPEPIAVPRATFDAARKGYAKAKQRMVTMRLADSDRDSNLGSSVAWEPTLRAAVAEGVAGYNRPPVPQFAANIGLAGLQKFHRLLTDGRDPKRWGKVFGEGQRAAIGLSRLVDCIDHAYTAPAAGRPLHADFLDEAAAVVDEPRWVEAAGLLRQSGERWGELATLASSAHPALRRHADVSDERAAELDGGQPDEGRMGRLATEQAELIVECDLGAGDAAALFVELARPLGRIIAAETEALDLLGG